MRIVAVTLISALRRRDATTRANRAAWVSYPATKLAESVELGDAKRG